MLSKKNVCWVTGALLLGGCQARKEGLPQVSPVVQQRVVQWLDESLGNFPPFFCLTKIVI